MNKLFAEDLERIGAPQRCLPLTAEQDARLSQHLPESFMDFLREYGFGDYFNRKIQYCDPQEFRPILTLLFAGDKDFSPKDCHVIYYTAFGVLKVWSERHDSFEVDLVDLWVTSQKLARTEFIPMPGVGDMTPSTDPNVLARTLIPFRDTKGDTFDANDKLMFDRCVKAHGSLERGECYGFFPAIAMAGYNTDLRRVMCP